MLEAAITDKHCEHMVLKVTDLQNHPVILSIDWLALHNPSINWKTNVVHFEDSFCQYTCFLKYSSSCHIDHVISTFPEVKDPLVLINSYAPHEPGSMVEDFY